MTFPLLAGAHECGLQLSPFVRIANILAITERNAGNAGLVRWVSLI